MENNNVPPYLDLLYQKLKLQTDVDRLSEKLEKSEEERKELSSKFWKQVREANAFEASRDKYRKRFRFFVASTTILLFVALISVTGLFAEEKRSNALRDQLSSYSFLQDVSVSDFNSIEELYQSRYAAGYDKAISGETPDPILVKCFHCGYFDPDYNESMIVFHTVNSIRVPLCVDCMSASSESDPIRILGEDFYFDSASKYTSNFMQELDAQALLPSSSSSDISVLDALHAYRERILANSKFIGNSTTKEFHKSTCSHLPGINNSVPLSSRSIAISSGYNPCEYCDP